MTERTGKAVTVISSPFKPKTTKKKPPGDYFYSFSFYVFLFLFLNLYLRLQQTPCSTLQPTTVQKYPLFVS